MARHRSLSKTASLKVPERGSRTEVIGPTAEPIETPAGKLKVIEIGRTDSGAATFFLTHFYSPDTKSVVKLIADVHIPGAAPEHIEMELIKYSVQ